MNRRSFLTSLLALPLAGLKIEALPKPRKTRLELTKENAIWGTYGKGGYEHCHGTCPAHPLRWVRLIDCETEHLQAIMSGKWYVPKHYVVIINSILDDRGV